MGGPWEDYAPQSAVTGPPPGFNNKQAQSDADLGKTRGDIMNTAANTDRTRNEIVTSNRGAPPQGYQYTPTGQLVPIQNAPQTPPPTGYHYKPDGTLEAIPGVGNTPDKIVEATSQVPAAQVSQQDLNDLKRLYSAGPGATKGVFGVEDFFPTAANKNFDAKAQTFRSLIANAKGLTGGQLNTPAEADAQIGPYIPQASDYDSTIQQKMQDLQRMIDANNASISIKAGQPAPPQQDRQQAVPPGLPVGGGGAPPGPPLINSNLPPDPGATTSLTPGSQNYSVGPDPALAGANDRVRAMVGGGASADDIRGYLNKLSPGLGDTAYPLVQKQVDFRKQHPEVPLSAYPVEVDRKAFPMSSVDTLWNAAAQSPVGAGAITAGNAATAGLLPYAVGNPRRTQAGIAGISSMNPKSALAGNLIGGAAGIAGLDAGLARAGLKGAGMFGARPLIADAAYGGVSGAANNPDAPLTGALTGAALNTVGGIAGRGAAAGLASAVAPRANDLGELYAAGVRPTIGQRFVNRGGPIGKIVNGLEEGFQSLPGVGYVIKGARDQSRDQFERGAFNSALGEIGGSLPDNMSLGTQPHAFMQDAFSKAYDRVLPQMQANLDPTFQQNAGMIVQDAANGGLSGDSFNRFQNIVTSEVDRRAGQAGVLSGEDLKSAVSNINKRIQAIRSSPSGDGELANYLEDYAGELKDAASRSSSPGAVAALAQVDRGYAKGVRIEQAAQARGGDTGRFTPTQFDRAVQQTTGGTRSRAYLRGDALLGDYAEQGKNLVDRLPNSGTADRLLASQGIVGAGGTASVMANLASIPALAKVGALALPYLPGARSVVGAALAPRESPTANAIAGFIRRKQAIPGMFAAPYALSYGQGN